MPPPFLTPGVFVEETPSGVPPITPLPSSITAFVGRAWRGPLDTPVMVYSMSEYLTQFGQAWEAAPMGWAVLQYFDNGGGQALIVRVATQRPGAAIRAAKFGNEARCLFTAISPGSWGLNLRLRLSRDPGEEQQRFSLEVRDDPDLHRDALQRGGSGATELFHGLSTQPDDLRYVVSVLARESRLLNASDAFIDNLVLDDLPLGEWMLARSIVDENLPNNDDGEVIGFEDIAAPANEDAGNGIFALRKAPCFNLLCIPPFSDDTPDNGIETWKAASRLCRERRALLIVDAPAHWKQADALSGIQEFHALERSHAALYFPRLLAADPVGNNAMKAFAPCGAVAGVIARTDVSYGIWHTPAGLHAGLRGGAQPSLRLSDEQQGTLNPQAVNVIRIFHDRDTVIWGARTLAGSDTEASEWKYVPVRRTALWIEQCLIEGTRWAAFEPNDEPLWARLRHSANAFMHQLFRQGAFKGTTPTQAYFVQCDARTMTQAEREQGIARLLVGFAPLRPAEFIHLKLDLRTASVED